MQVTQPRLATNADLSAVQRIVESAYSHYVPRIGREPGPMLDDYQALISAGLVHVIERGGVTEAMLVLIPQDDAMLLDNVAVAPGAQGLGLGRTMIEFAERTARLAGHRAIKLYTNEAMVENLKLYSRIGYVETHRAVENELRRVYMSKYLD